MAVSVEANILQGMDAVVQVVGPQGAMLVGGFQEWDVTVRHTLSPYPELGAQIDLQLPGKVQIEGNLRRGWQDTASVARLLGTPTVNRNTRFRPPKFTVTATVVAPGKTDNGRRMQFMGCSFTSVGWGARSAEGAIDESVAFTAEEYQYLS